MPSVAAPVRSPRRTARVILLAASAVLLIACDEKAPALSKSDEPPPPQDLEFETPDLGEVTDKGPRLGALTDKALIYSAAHKKAPILGYLHAGDTVARSEKSYENDQCTEGWYRVYPRGYVCTEKSASTNLDHPTLRTMALRPNAEAALPYVYARTTKVTALFEKRDKQGVELSGRLSKSTVMAIVGSWTAPDESHEPQRLGLRMDGRFVRADDLEAAGSSDFAGVHLNDDVQLPIGYVVRRGVRTWKMGEGVAEKQEELAYHERLPLSGRFRTVQGHRFWAVNDGRWVRHEDVTVLRRRHEFPEFAREGQRWLDISIVTGTLIAYEGNKPVFATLVSVGRDRLGDPKTTASTEQGLFRIVGKHLTRRDLDSPDTDLFDAPWALELESGDFIHAAPHHDRFGIEHSEGHVEVSPADGKFLFGWTTPEFPQGWHGVVADPSAQATFVLIRK